MGPDTVRGQLGFLFRFLLNLDLIPRQKLSSLISAYILKRIFFSLQKCSLGFNNRGKSPCADYPLSMVTWKGASLATLLLVLTSTVHSQRPIGNPIIYPFHI